MKLHLSGIPAIILALMLAILICSGCRKEDEPEIVSDIDGNIYKTLQIGSQTWMVENLKTIRYRNGDTIQSTQPSTMDISTEQAPVYQWPYEGDERQVRTYGRLYTWYAATDSRNICPAGWHVPTDAELTVFENFTGGIDISGNLNEYLGGYRSMDGVFDSIGLTGYWWSATALGEDSAWMRRVNAVERLSDRKSMEKKSGFAVKCLKD